jgi:hypothetical protein
LRYFAAFLLLAGCASAPPPAEPAPSITACVPAFCADGRFRRDILTDAPLFEAPAESLARRAPRFNGDGTVGRDLETGAPLYDEVSGGEVVRVFVLVPR